MSNYWLQKKSDSETIPDSQFVTSTTYNNDITFFCKNKEMLRLSPNGFFVEGRLVTDDKEVYKGMVNFLLGIK